MHVASSLHPSSSPSLHTPAACLQVYFPPRCPKHLAASRRVTDSGDHFRVYMLQDKLLTWQKMIVITPLSSTILPG